MEVSLIGFPGKELQNRLLAWIALEVRVLQWMPWLKLKSMSEALAPFTLCLPSVQPRTQAKEMNEISSPLEGTMLKSSWLKKGCFSIKQRGIAACITYFSHHWDQMPDRKQLKGVRVYFGSQF